jgi:hypothetical protein
LQQVDSFLDVLKFPPPIKTDHHDITELFLKETLNTITFLLNFIQMGAPYVIFVNVWCAVFRYIIFLYLYFTNVVLPVPFYSVIDLCINNIILQNSSKTFNNQRIKVFYLKSNEANIILLLMCYLWLWNSYIIKCLILIWLFLLLCNN